MARLRHRSCQLVALGRNTRKGRPKSAHYAEATQPGRRGLWTRGPEPIEARTQEDAMTAPFIFIGTHKIKPGRREEYKRYFA
jgi:hypothetical protein